MATHDYVLANQAGVSFRSDLNNALAAIVSQNSSATEPTTTYAYMPWFDTTNGILKFRNAANSGWVIDDLNSARGSVTMHATTMDLWAEPKIIDGTGSSVTITDIADAPQAGAVRILYPVAGTTITDGATFDVDGGANYTTAAGDALIFEAVTTSTFKVHIIKADGTPIVVSTSAVPGNIYGLTGSSAGGTTLTVAAGYATDSTNTVLMQLASAMAKTTAAWSAGTGNGGLDTGSIATATWYHWYLIRNPSSGAVDLVFSTNASSPTLPSGYTQYRRIFTWRYTGGGIWEQIVQNGNEFLWPTAPIDINAQNPGTSAVTRTLSVPTGIIVDALISIGCYYGSTAFTALVSPLSTTDSAPQASGTAALSGISNASSPTNTAGWNFFPARIRTNTSAQVRSRLSASGANDRLGLITFGWIDTRGQ